jgi:hypothetical protein
MKLLLAIVASLSLVVVVVAGAMALTGGETALGAGQCRNVRGDLVLSFAPDTPTAWTGTVTGTAKGEFRGAVTGTYEMNFFVPVPGYPGWNPRQLSTLNVTSKDGTPTTLIMDFVGTNFQGPDLVGGGVITQAAGSGDTVYNLSATMAPGWNTPMEWAYSGQKCIE